MCHFDLFCKVYFGSLDVSWKRRSHGRLGVPPCQDFVIVYRIHVYIYDHICMILCVNKYEYIYIYYIMFLFPEHGVYPQNSPL